MDNQPQNHNEPNLADILSAMWDGKWFMLVGMVICAVISMVFAANVPPYYRASVIMAPSSLPLTALSAVANGDGGIRSSELALSPARFIQMARDPATPHDNFQRIEVVLTGQAVAAKLFEDPHIRAIVKNDTWTIGKKDAKDLSINKLDEYLDRAIDIRRVGDSDLRKVIYAHPDKLAAQYLLTHMINAANQHIQSHDRQNLSLRVKHLKALFDQNTNPVQRQALAYLLAVEEQRLLLANQAGVGQDDGLLPGGIINYASDIIDPVSISSRPIWPQKTLLLVLALFFGAILGAIAHSIWRRYMAN